VSRAGRRYLVLAALDAVGAANAYRPLSRRGAPSVVSFASGWPTSEFALQAIAAQAVLTAGAARRGALRGTAGKLGLLVHAATWVALGRLQRQASRCDEVLEAALGAELGAGYRQRAAPSLIPPPGAPLSLREAALPSMSRRLIHARQIPYGDAGVRNLLDVWRRPDLPTETAAPVLLQVHGGAWVIGDKDTQGIPLMGLLAALGWICVSINYRLSPSATWPDQIVDVKRAIVWIKQNIAAYGGDPGFIAVTGGSAGGHLSALAALTPNEPEYQPGFEDRDTTVQAAVPFYGVYDFTDRDGKSRADMLEFLERRVFKSRMADDPVPFERASPLIRVGPGAPPFFCLHGTNDSLAPIEQARAFVDVLRKESRQPVVFAELPRTQHAFDVLPSVRAQHAARAVARFLSVVYGEHLGIARPAGLGGCAPAGLGWRT